MKVPAFTKLKHPSEGNLVKYSGGKARPGNFPIIPFIEGDGIGPDIWRAARMVIEAAVEKTFSGKKKIMWLEVYAGEKAKAKYDHWLPEDTLKAIAFYKVAIKGPLTTPVGGGFRSLNVSLRQKLDLFSCVRPVRWYRGVPSPVKKPGKVNIVIFRENTEDVYAGVEWEKDSPEVKKVIDFLNNEMKQSIREDSGIGIKPISETGSKRLVRSAIRYAIENKLPSVTLMAKGNIMKFTEGSFVKWGFELAGDEFAAETVIEDDLQGPVPTDKIVVKTRIADSMFQQVLLRPEEYSVIATTNLNGDYISDATAAQVGGLGMAPGANINWENGSALFEATHGTAPKYVNMDKVNPGSLLLSGVMMLEYIGWRGAAKKITRALERTIRQKYVTYDLERQIKGATLAKCSEFGKRIIENL